MKLGNRSGNVTDRQLPLPLFPLRNQNFLSNHWLQHRLSLEPEWRDNEHSAERALQELLQLWRTEKNRVELYGDEAGLEEKFIQPVFKTLGWQLKYQTYLNRRKPDYALFFNDQELTAAINSGKTNPDFWNHVRVVADAKAWHINLDRPSGGGTTKEYPPEQIEWYLNHSRCDYGILTNGRLWRLVPRTLGPAKPRFETYLEVNLPELLESLDPKTGQLSLHLDSPSFRDFLIFYLLFSPTGFLSEQGRKPLIQRAVDGSSEYFLGVGDELKDRVFEALRVCVEGFLHLPTNSLRPENDLSACKEHSLVFLYRILFVMYAEDRGLLPYRRNSTYTNNRSLARYRDDVATRIDEVSQGLPVSDYENDKTGLWKDLQELFDLIDRGHRRYGVPAYNGGLFDLEANKFLTTKKLSDWHVSRVLDQLGRAPQPNLAELGLFRVDYRDLTVQELGSVYEGLLEIHPQYAEEDMLVVRSESSSTKKELIQPASQSIPNGFKATAVTFAAGTIYLATDKGERRRTGSYYTPDHIVDHIVQKTLGAQCEQIFNDLEAEIAALQKTAENAPINVRIGYEKELEDLRGSFDDRVLKLKILDPALGSGHFLIRACQFLAEEIATNPYTSDHSADELEDDESTITYWKRKVAENCLHGVDINPMAIELAKLALWLETVAEDAPLTFLDHKLKCGDSLIGAKLGHLTSLPGDEGLLEGQFSEQVQAHLPALLEPLTLIRDLPSDTLEQVKEKERTYRKRFIPALERFITVADLWVAESMNRGSVDPARYAQMLDSMISRGHIKEAANSDWYREATSTLYKRKVQPLHWELTFPSVFLGKDDHLGGRGFDVIFGNPPYDVVSEKESGKPVDHLLSFIGFDPQLKPTQAGKNNLYKLFIARSHGLLRDGGRLGFIVPMPLLGDAQAKGIRELLLSGGQFEEISVFPQKDKIAARVFPHAKLATTMFIYRKRLQSEKNSGRFVSQVHRGRYILESSPTLMTDSNSIRVYDPTNLTIVSCTQRDWDLMASLSEESIARLGQFTEFFQGEVNQTNASSKGLLKRPHEGQLVARGACISLYKLREASQGEDFYLDVNEYLKGSSKNSKAFHHRLERIALQESSPQNNFRRIIACRIPSGQFCSHTINYTTSEHCGIDLSLALFILNSVFADWYFRLGSTNAHVSQYQIRNIPTPRFGSSNETIDHDMVGQLESELSKSDIRRVEERCMRMATDSGCTPTLESIIARLVRHIEAEEEQRGMIKRSARSHLSERSAKCQEILDKVLLILLGLGAERYEYVRTRVNEML